jgi:hypothetical protein
VPNGGKGAIKYWNLHQSHKAYWLKKKGGKLNKTPSLEKPSLVIIVRLKMEVALFLVKPMRFFVYKRNVTLIKKRPLMPFVPHIMLAHWW